MNLPKSLSAALGLLGVLVIIGVIYFMMSDGAPGAATVKGMVEKQMAARYPGNAIKAISVVDGGKFLSQGHAGRVPYGTPVYPMFVRVSFATPLPNGSQEFTRTWFLYKNAKHEWARDTDVN